MQVQCQYTLRRNFMKIEFENSITKFSFFSRLLDMKIAWINPCLCGYISLKPVQIWFYLQTEIRIIKNPQI